MSVTTPRILAAAVAALVLAAAPSPAAAQSSKSDAFAGKIPPVSGQLYRKAGRFEATATANLSLNDAFFTKYFGGVKAGYHFTEHWYAGVAAAGGAVVKTNSAIVCSATRGCADADATMLKQVPGRIRYIVGLEGAWSPVYGKLNVLSEQVAHFDLSILAGPDLVAHDEVLQQDVADRVNPKVLSSVGGHLGLGFRIFLGESVAARIEVKDYLYTVKVPNGGIGSDLQNQLFAELGVSLFFPGRNRPIR
jgi:outer membrane beta-barrel protein